MATITFDTLKFVERLRAGGVPEEQAKAEAEALIIGDGPRFISLYPVFLRIIKKGVSFVFLKIVFQVAKACHVYHLKRHG